MNSDEILVQIAYEIAANAHHAQFRKKSHLPYIVHPCRVASKVAMFHDAILTAAAFTHDVLEDCDKEKLPYFISELKNLDPNVYNIVNELTYKGNSKAEKEDYLKSFSTKSTRALIIKLLDRLDNIEDFYNFGDSEYAVIYANKARVLVDIWDNYSIDKALQTGYNLAQIDNIVEELIDWCELYK